jgi:hypothetical protein
MEKRVRFLEALQKLLLINPGNITPGSFTRRAYVLELIGQIYSMNDSDDMLDWLREIIEIYNGGTGTWWELWEPLEEMRRALILQRIEQQAEKPYWERTTHAMLEKVLREFMKTYLLGVQSRGLGKVISMLKLINQAFKKDAIQTLRILATYMDEPLTKEKFIIQKLREIINPPEPEPELPTWDELPF